MTVSSTVARVQFSGNGVAATFAFPYVFIAPADLAVTLTDSTGAVVPATLGGAGAYDYTVTGSLDPTTGEYDSGGNVVFNTAPPGGYTATILRDPAETQTLAIAPTGPVPPAPLSAALDKVVMMLQALKDRFSRTIGAPVQDSPALNMQLPPAALRANQYLGFDSLGQPSVLLSPVTISAAASATMTVSGTVALPAGFTGSVYIANAGPGLATITLPPNPTTGQKVKLLDVLGSAATYATAIQSANGSTILGNAALTLQDNYQAVEMEWNGATWSAK